MSKIICVSIVLLVAAMSAMAERVLVAVELLDIDAKKAWHALGLPTYQFVGSAAVAECDEKQIAYLERKGFRIAVIDREPWSRDYYLISLPPGQRSLAAGQIILERAEATLVKADRDGAEQMRAAHLKPLPVRRRPLPERFWKQVMTKYICPKSLPWDPFIQGLVDQVNADSITSYIQRLQDFYQRGALTDSSFAASQWIYNKMANYGYAASFDSFMVQTATDTGYERNVTGTNTGQSTPGVHIIVSGHFDTNNDNPGYCYPGADDDASGTACALEVARVMKNQPWNKTLVAAAWGAEEEGCVGSESYARDADSLDADIEGVLNFDMIGYTNSDTLDCKATSNHIGSLLAMAATIYVPTLIVIPGYNVSDDYSFADHGFPAMGCIEYPGPGSPGGYPHYHHHDDSLVYLNPSLFTNVTKAAVASVAMMQLSPGMVESVSVHDLCDGARLVVQWTPNPETDLTGYWVYWGLSSGIYSDSTYVSGQTAVGDTLSGLLADSLYYCIVRAVNGSGYQSWASTEVTGTPRLNPVKPIGLSAEPVWHGMRLIWQQNPDPDLAGYRLYRRLNQAPQYDSLNTILITDTTHTDSSLSGENSYFYRVRAFDIDGNYGMFSDSAYGRPATLDQGILVVDETQNWTSGSWPRDSIQDRFYDSILVSYRHQDYDFGSAALRPVLADLVPYSSVLWHGDDNSQFMASGSVTDLKRYLDFGGNLWFVGWKPTSDIRNSGLYPAFFTDTSFIRTYFRIDSVTSSGSSDSFQMAAGSNGYPNITVDPAKVPIPSWGGTMRYIERYTPSNSGEVIYIMDMKNNSSPFEGSICGVRYLGPTYKTVLFGFPLYFMDRDQARLAATQVMADFGETGVAQGPSSELKVPSLELFQNIPNPFSRSTVIRYQLPRAGRVSLKVYNVAGQLVRTLAEGVQQAGQHSAAWDGKDFQGRLVSSGVYYCHLEAGGQAATSRLVVIK